MAKWHNGSTSNTTQNREFEWIIRVDIPQNNCKGVTFPRLSFGQFSAENS